MSQANTSIAERLKINTNLARTILVGFIADQIAKAGMKRAVIGLSGGLDSAVSAYLTAEALGPENLLAIRMPHKTSSPDSLNDADAVIKALGLPSMTIPITEMADPLFARFPDMSERRKGNVMARLRMTILYDQSVPWG